MDKTKLIETLETCGITALVAFLGYVAAHATDIDPTWGPAIGAIALGATNLLNQWLHRPAEKISAMALGSKSESEHTL